MKCRVCKCTDDRACFPPCDWAEPELCTTCAEVILRVREWLDQAHRPAIYCMIAEARKPILAERAMQWGRKFEAMGRL